MVAPTSVIFKKERIYKKDWYARVKELMLNAGWKNLSKTPEPDGDVFWTDGTSGKLDLMIRLREYYASPAATNSISNSTDRQIYYTLPYSYTPGTATTPGVFGQVATDTNRMLVSVGQMSLNASFDLYYNVNKNRAIFITDSVPGNSFVDTGEHIGTIIWIGVSDRTHMDTMRSLKNPFVAASQQVFITGVAAGSLPYQPSTPLRALTTYMDIPPRNPIRKDSLFMSEIAFGKEDGIIGFIDGIYGITTDVSNTPVRGDSITDEMGNKYRVIEINPPYSGQWIGSFTATRFYAIRVEEGS